ELRLREPAGLQRLQQRVRAEVRKRRSARTLLLVRIAGMAAALLLTVGLVSWASSLKGPSRSVGLVETAQVVPGKGAVYQVLASHEMDVQQGQVRVRVEPGSPQAKAVKVHTPAGTATTSDGEFLVQVSPKN